MSNILKTMHHQQHEQHLNDFANFDCSQYYANMSTALLKTHLKELKSQLLERGEEFSEGEQNQTQIIDSPLILYSTTNESSTFIVKVDEKYDVFDKTIKFSSILPEIWTVTKFMRHFSVITTAIFYFFAIIYAACILSPFK